MTSAFLQPLSLTHLSRFALIRLDRRSIYASFGFPGHIALIRLDARDFAHVTPPSFTIHGMQYINGGDSSDDIAVHCLLDKNPRWKAPAEWVPQLNTVVSFHGILD